MLWIFLACTFDPAVSSVSAVQNEEVLVSMAELQEQVFNIGDRSWRYPSTGLVVSFTDDRPEFLQARALFTQKKHTEAGEILISLIQENPNEAAYHSLLSSVMLSLGDVNQAKQAALQAVTLYPAAITHVNLAVVYQANKEFVLAEEHYKKAHHFAPKFFLPLRNLSSLRYQSGDLKEAEQYLRDLMKIEPEDSYVYVALAEVLVEQKRAQEAKEILEYRIQELQWIDPAERVIDSGMMLDLPLALGELYRRDGDWRRAEYWFEYTIQQGSEIDSSLDDEIRYQVTSTIRLIEMYLEYDMKEKAKLRFVETEKMITEKDLKRKRHLEMEMSRMRELQILLGLTENQRDEDSF